MEDVPELIVGTPLDGGKLIAAATVCSGATGNARQTLVGSSVNGCLGLARIDQLAFGYLPLVIAIRSRETSAGRLLLEARGSTRPD